MVRNLVKRGVSVFFICEAKKREKNLWVRKKVLPLQPHLEKCTSIEGSFAEIAQLVEHNLAKVGVAGPSPVFRSHSATDEEQVLDLLL